jgi:polysaccharide biosynthesis protein PslG
MKLNLLALAGLAPLLMSGAEIPEPVLPAGVGVNIHFVTGRQTDLDLIAAAGFKFIRMDFHWGGLEAKKGEYQWAGYEELLSNLDRRGLRAILILDYSNPLYEPAVDCPHPITGQPHRATASPQHPESIAAFARWAAAAAKHFQGRHVIWEIWNEPNGHFWSPKPDAEQYAALALATAKAIRQADPQATIAGPASAGFPWPFLETFLRSGVLEQLDAVTVHPYRRPTDPPETAAADYERLRAMIDRCAPEAKRGKVPILSGEWGYSTWKQGVTLETQAAFAPRQQLANLLHGIPLSIWYDWQNDGPDPNENEHNFGTVWPDLRPKPAYTALQTLTRELAGFRIARRLPLAGDQDYALVCAGPDRSRKLVAWTLGAAHSVTLDAALKPGPDPAGRLVLELTAAPQYLALSPARE